jgi:hypothetical protein
MDRQGLKRFVRRPRAARPVAPEPRLIRLDGRDVPYLLRRSARRSFALQVDAGGVKVAVPDAARDAEVERFIAGHARWLLGKLDACAARPAPARFEPADGAEFALLGEPCRLRLGAAGRTARWRTGPDGCEELVLGASLDAGTALIRALRRRALPWFTERVAEYCFRLGRPVPPVRLSSARTRWGSCSAASGIRLHWRLIHLAPTLIDYVVAHEVAHLVEMNHSPRFWAVVGELYPDWKVARARLREAAGGLPLIGGGTADGPVNED